MVIKNSTPWSTSDIKAVFRRCVKEVEKVRRPKLPFHRKNKHFKLDILNGTHWSGRATVNGYWIMARIPREWSIKREMPSKPNEIDLENKYNVYWVDGKNSSSAMRIPFGQEEDIKNYPSYWPIVGNENEISYDNKVQFARILIHEYFHSIGYGYEDIDHHNYAHDFTNKWNVDWIKEYPIRIKEKQKGKTTDEKFQLKYDRAVVNFRRSETRLKRAKTIFNKWQRKVSYYEIKGCKK
jgi:hypothetical protein